jgi:hypothetical protein
MKGSKLALANAAAKIQTAGTAIAALDSAASTLANARVAVANATAAHALENPFATGVSIFTGSEGEMRQDLTDHIDIVQSLVAGHRARYKGYVGDDLDQEISTLSSMQVANALQRALSVFNDAMDWLNDPPEFDLVGGIIEAIEAAIAAGAKIVNNALQAAANLAAGVATAFWVPIVVGAGVVGLVVVWRQGWLKGAA